MFLKVDASTGLFPRMPASAWKGRPVPSRGWVRGSELNHREHAGTQIQSPVMFLIHPFPPVRGQFNFPPSNEAPGKLNHGLISIPGVSCDGRAQGTWFVEGAEVSEVAGLAFVTVLVTGPHSP